MNPALKSALIELKNDGVQLDPIADLEHIITLYHLAEAVTDNPVIASEHAILNPVLKIGSLTLRYLSVGARRWVADRAAEWLIGDKTGQDLAYVFAMAHTEQPEILWAIEDARTLKKALALWSRTIDRPWSHVLAEVGKFLTTKPDTDSKPGPATLSAAMVALHTIVPLPDQYAAELNLKIEAMTVAHDIEAKGYGPVIESLCKEHDKTPEYWLWRVSEVELDYLLTVRRERMDLEARAERVTTDSRFQRAHYRFVTYKDNLLKTKKAAKP